MVINTKLINKNFWIHLIICVLLIVVCWIGYFIGNICIIEKKRNEFLRTVNCAEIIEKNGVDNTYKLSFECKADVPGEVLVYFQNGDCTRYFFEEKIQVSTDYEKYELEVHPILVDESVEESYLAFYGGYGTGVIPRVRKISFEVKK